jgi:hypothetical protein
MGRRVHGLGNGKLDADAAFHLIKSPVPEVVACLLLTTHLLTTHLLTAHLLTTHLLTAHLLTTHLLTAHLLTAHLLLICIYFQG